jgi:hypothetical protein
MTIPLERTYSVLRARQLLIELETLPESANLAVIRQRARAILRHFPERVHIHVSAAMAPSIWADPDEKWCG